MSDILESINSILNKATQWPVYISNKDCSLIEESAILVEILENDGYKVETFVNRNDNTYGFVVYGRVVDYGTK